MPNKYLQMKIELKCFFPITLPFFRELFTAILKRIPVCVCVCETSWHLHWIFRCSVSTRPTVLTCSVFHSSILESWWLMSGRYVILKPCLHLRAYNSRFCLKRVFFTREEMQTFPMVPMKLMNMIS